MEYNQQTGSIRKVRHQKLSAEKHLHKTTSESSVFLPLNIRAPYQINTSEPTKDSNNSCVG